MKMKRKCVMWMGRGRPVLEFPNANVCVNVMPMGGRFQTQHLFTRGMVGHKRGMYMWAQPYVLETSGVEDP